jgi:NADH-quinone oxidoreductase subunit A
LNTGAAPAYSLWPMGVFFICTAIIAGLMIGVSFLLGQRHRGRVTNEPYESGMPITGGVDLRFSVKYYLVAMFFVIFDVEALFIFAWAVSARALGWPGYIEIVIFIVVLLAVLLYLSKLGAFDWGTPRQRKSREGEEGTS